MAKQSKRGPVKAKRVMPGDLKTAHVISSDGTTSVRCTCGWWACSRDADMLQRSVERHAAETESELPPAQHMGRSTCGKAAGRRCAVQ